MFSWHSTHTRFAHFISLDFFRLLFHKSTMEWISLIAVLISCSLIGRVILLMSYFAYSFMIKCNKFMLQVLNITTKMLEFHTSSQPLRWRLASMFVQIDERNFPYLTLVNILVLAFSELFSSWNILNIEGEFKWILGKVRQKYLDTLVVS